MFEGFTTVRIEANGVGSEWLLTKIRLADNEL